VKIVTFNQEPNCRALLNYGTENVNHTADLVTKLHLMC